MILSNGYYVVVFMLLFVLCFIESSGKPSFSLNFPTNRQEPEQSVFLKIYTGRRIDNNSLRMVYYNDQTVAVVELGPNKTLLNCELIEILEENQLFRALGDLKTHARPVAITFSEMVTLMSQCKELEERQIRRHKELMKNDTPSENKPKKAANALSLLSGIIPGTKWCGTGDIADNYYDLGEDRVVDTCCRAHDLCPVKIRAYSKKYNLTNSSLYTKSHCKCDDDLYNCLKKANSSHTAQIMGNIYFNLVQVPCLEDTVEGRKYRKSRNNF